MISVTVNGEARQLSAMSCGELVASLDLAGKRIALERNGEIVPRGRLGEEMLADGDRIEIVVAVGGG
jgi:sulfur carrier protein